MCAYLTRAERAALALLPVAGRRRVLAERFARECPNAEHAEHPGLVFRPGAPADSFDFAAARELDQIEAQIEREQSPPARIVQLVAPAVPVRISRVRYDARGRLVEFDHQTPVLALALRADGTISAVTEHDVNAEGAIREYHPYPEIETGRAYYLDQATGEAAPTVPDTAAEEMSEIAGAYRAAQSAVARLAPVKKAQARK